MIYHMDIRYYYHIIFYQIHRIHLNIYILNEQDIKLLNIIINLINKIHHHIFKV